jgi:hypothetical protein
MRALLRQFAQALIGVEGNMLTTEKPCISERAQQARERAQKLAERQGIKPLSFEELMTLGWSEPDPNFDFEKWRKEWRQEEQHLVGQ